MTPISHAGLELRRDGLPLALWNRDVAAAMPDGNIYGSWPVYIDIRPGERVLVLNSTRYHRTPGDVHPNRFSTSHQRELSMHDFSLSHHAQMGEHTGCSC